MAGLSPGCLLWMARCATELPIGQRLINQSSQGRPRGRMDRVRYFPWGLSSYYRKSEPRVVSSVQHLGARYCISLQLHGRGFLCEIFAFHQGPVSVVDDEQLRKPSGKRHLAHREN